MRGALLSAGLWLLASACGGSSVRSGDDGDDRHPCGTTACADSCDYDGESYAVGATFPASDGCNSCSCEVGGRVSCTERGCSRCRETSATYNELTQRALACDPDQPNQCTLRVTVGLSCGCDAFVNPARWDDAAIQAAARDYSAMSCGGEALCGECDPAVSGSCSAEGVCVTDSEPKDGVACRVDGVTYPDGADDVPDPYSCNRCQCDDGHLLCTEIGCPKPCPDRTLPGTSCAACGPADECQVLETGCFPACVGTCAEGECVAGVCKHTCG